jgi:hypothetical protein
MLVMLLDYYQKLWDSGSTDYDDDNVNTNTNNSAKLMTETSVSRRYFSNQSQK